MSTQANMAARYEREIPEGYEARIEGNKVIIELKESEDERIRKRIVDFIKSHADEFEKSTDTWDMLTYLEKQKEHQNNSDAREKALGRDLTFPQGKDKNLDEIAQDYVDGVKEYNPEPTWDLIQTAVCYGYHYCEQKPVEWSEEDEKMLNEICENLYTTPKTREKWQRFLKSLRPLKAL